MFRSSLRRLIIVPSISCPPFPAVATSNISVKETGIRFEHGWSMTFHSDGGTKPISPWHNISLKADPESPGDRKACSVSTKTAFNFVNEITRGMRDKIEMVPGKEHNFLVQDRNKDGSLRRFSYGEMPFDYGFLPRTYENPHVKDKHTGKFGDGDPVDVVFLPLADEQPRLPIGAISQVRIVGAFALLDQGETDWKMLAVPINSRIKNVDGVDPNVLLEVYNWFKLYKTTDGKAINEFAFEGRPVDADMALGVVTELSEQYFDAVCGKMAEKMKRDVWSPSSS